MYEPLWVRIVQEVLGQGPTEQLARPGRDVGRLLPGVEECPAATSYPVRAASVALRIVS